jgi:hypothetical protein
MENTATLPIWFGYQDFREVIIEGIKEIINNSKNESEDDRKIYCILFLFVHNK